jgi:hypothetical protein
MTTSTVKRPKLHSRRGPPCTVCVHSDRSRIEATRCAGASLDSVAAKFSISRDALHRHMHAHVDADQRSQYMAGVPIAELAQLAASEGVSVLSYLSLVRSILMQQFQLCASVNNANGVAVLGGRLNEILRSIGTISGEMSEVAARSVTFNGSTINITNHPEIATLQAKILEALEPFPSAAQAVVAALRAFDAASAPSAVPLMKTIEHHVET